MDIGRSKLIEMLQTYSSVTSEELKYKNNMIDFIKKNKNCFERSLSIGHITSSAWLLNKDKTKVLLMHHAKLDKWLQLGGHCDGVSDVITVAIKETREESGIQNIIAISDKIFDIGIHTIPVNNKEKEHDHYDIRFLLRVTSDEQIIQNRESKELRWVAKNKSELPTDSTSVVRMFNKWISMPHVY